MTTRERCNAREISHIFHGRQGIATRCREADSRGASPAECNLRTHFAWISDDSKTVTISVRLSLRTVSDKVLFVTQDAAQRVTCKIRSKPRKMKKVRERNGKRLSRKPFQRITAPFLCHCKSSFALCFLLLLPFYSLSFFLLLFLSPTLSFPTFQVLLFFFFSDLTHSAYKLSQSCNFFSKL